MKSKLLIAISLGVLIAACHKENSTVAPSTQQTNAKPHYAFRDSTDTAGSLFISTNIANNMISSYLQSINSTASDSNIHSFSISADSLRAYLANPAIKNVKLMFAHTQNYINAGNFGVYSGFQTGALTIVIAAYDSVGNYIYYGGNAVLDHCAPCPYSCASGTAGNDLLQ